MPSCTSSPVARRRQSGLERGVRAADAGVAGERHLAARAEDADADSWRRPTSPGREGGLRQPRPARDGLHGRVVQAFGVEHHGQRIAGAGAVGEDVELQVAARGHGGGLESRRGHSTRHLRARARMSGNAAGIGDVRYRVPRSLDRAQVRRHLGVASPSLGHHRPAGADERADEEDARVLVVVSALSGVTNELHRDRRWRRGQRRRALDALERAPSRIRAPNSSSSRTTCSASASPKLQALAADRARSVAHARRGRPKCWRRASCCPRRSAPPTCARRASISAGCDARDWLRGERLAEPERVGAPAVGVVPSRRPTPTGGARFAAQPARLLLTQGFIARHADGGTAILGRGGSDTSAAYFGALLGAQRVEIWTDVPGMFSANPRQVPRRAPADAAGLRRSAGNRHHRRQGAASALRSSPAATPACRWRSSTPSVPICPAPSIDGDAATVPGVKAISRRNGIVLVSMESIGMWQQVGFLADVFERFKRHGLSVDLIGSSETNVTVSLDPSENLVSTNVLAALSRRSGRDLPGQGDRAVRGDHAGRPRHALAAAQAVRRAGPRSAASACT